MLALYATIFRFPDLRFHLYPSLVISALLVSSISAVVGALLAARKAVKLPPAEAMRPPVPARYHRTLIERAGLARLLGPSGMMVAREIERRPLRTALGAIGMAGAVALIVFGHFGIDSLDDYLEGSLWREQRQDLTVAFTHPLPPRAVSELGALPGVLHVEGSRAAPIRVRHEHRQRDCVLMGLPERALLRRIISKQGSVIEPPEDGVVMTRTLGEILGLHVGDRVDIEVREGDRPRVRPVIAGFVDESVGLQVYALASTVSALERDSGAFSAALLRVDPRLREDVEEHLRRSPHVIDVSDLKGDMERLRALNGSVMDVWTAVSISLSACIIFGVVYNNARIALTMRSRELASLRVLGMSRRQISAILIWGLAIELGLAIPLGLVLGRVQSGYFMTMVDPEAFRWTIYVAPMTYLMAAATAALAGAASALWVRRSLDKLDLIGVLKTRE